MGGRTRANSINRYMAKAYDRISLIVPKGRKEAIKDHAAARGESLNAFIVRAINAQIERDCAEPPAEE